MSGDSKELYDNLAKLIESTNKNQTTELKKQIQVEVAGLKNEITEIKEIIAKETGKRKQLEERQLRLENTQEHIERIIKKNNVLVFGLKCDNHENLTEFTIAKLNSLLELNLTVANINNIFQLGKQDGNRPILVQFLSFLTKIQVLKNCKKLKGTGISISDDLTKEQREIRRSLVKHKKLAQGKGYNAYIKNNKLYINDEAHTYEDLIEDQQIEVASLVSTSKNQKINSAPATPSRTKEYETDGEVADDEIGVEEGNVTDDGEVGRKEININPDSEKIVISENNNEGSDTSSLKGKSQIIPTQKNVNQK